MNTKILMISSSIFLASIGILLSFLPNEIIFSLGLTTVSLQLMGALYLGFAMINWMAKGAPIGGIYNKPIAIGNLMHFGVGAIALVKIVSNMQEHSEIIIPLTVVYVIFASLFAYVFRTNPIKAEKKKRKIKLH